MDDQQTRGRPVLKRLDTLHEVKLYAKLDTGEDDRALDAGRIWFFCGEYGGKEQQAADTAAEEWGVGVFKVFPSGSWPGGYLRD